MRTTPIMQAPLARSCRLGALLTAAALGLASPQAARGQATGSIAAWGWNDYAQCSVPAPNTGFVAAAGGYYHSLGLKADGSIVAWGFGEYGQASVPAPNAGFVAAAAGVYHSLGLKANGSIVAWGWNDQGACNVPAPNTGFVAVAAGFHHSLGLKADGSIAAWGNNDYLQCNVPPPNSGFVAVAAGDWHSLGLKTDGSIVAWGTNDFGQCSVPAPNTGFVAVAGGAYHSLGLHLNGSIVAWGFNDDGQCNVPAPNTAFVAVAAGAGHSLGLRADGSIEAWGSNAQDQSDVPAPNAGFVAIAGGAAHSLAVRVNTPTGAPISVGLNGGDTTAGGATVVLSSVASPGETTMTTPGGCAGAPDGFIAIRPPPPAPAEQTCFDISTTAIYGGPVHVCFNYSGWAVSSESSLELRHWNGSVWEQPLPGTFSLDTFNDIICGSFWSLSPMAIFERHNQPPVVTCNGPVTLWSPQHDLVDAGSAFSVFDPDGDPTALTLRVLSDETEVPETGDGTGQHAPDFKNELYPGGRGLLLRSERSNRGDGRGYIVVVTADDGRGGVAIEVCVAAVCPRDQNQRSLDDVLAQIGAAAVVVRSTINAGGSLPPVGMYEHGWSASLGPHQ